MSQPLLSVIIPTYNRAELVRECLASLRAAGVGSQASGIGGRETGPTTDHRPPTPDSRLEVIVADDGSTDDTREVVEREWPGAKYLWQPNSGTPATARNLGFAESRGKYVAFVDCDDRWLPGVAGQVLRLLEEHPQIDVLFTEARMGNETEGYRSWIEMGGEQAFFELPCEQPAAGLRILARRPFFRRMAVRNAVFISAVVMRREAFERSGGFDPALRGAADWELWLRMASQMTFAYFEQPLAVYTRHLDGAANMSSDHDGMGAEFIRALEGVLRKCPHLPAEDRRLVERQLKHHLFGHAYAAYDRGENGVARRRFAELRRAGGLTAGSAAYEALCWLPAPVTGGLRRIKWAVTG